MGTQSTTGRTFHQHCSQAVPGSCSSILLSLWALLLALLCTAPSQSWLEELAEGTLVSWWTGAHTRPAKSRRGQGAAMGWLELMKLPALSTAYPGFKALSPYLCSSNGEGHGAACAASPGHERSPVCKSSPTQAPAFPALPAAHPDEQGKTLKENALNRLSSQQAGDEMWKKIRHKSYTMAASWVVSL